MRKPKPGRKALRFVSVEARAEWIVYQFRLGLTLKCIANDCGLTPERIGQILKEKGVPVPRINIKLHASKGGKTTAMRRRAATAAKRGKAAA